MYTPPTTLPHYLLQLSLTGLDDSDPSLDLKPKVVGEDCMEQFRDETTQDITNWFNSWDEADVRSRGFASKIELVEYWLNRHIASVQISGYPALCIQQEFAMHWFVELPYNKPFRIQCDKTGEPLIEVINDPTYVGIYVEDNDAIHNNTKYVVLQVQ